MTHSGPQPASAAPRTVPLRYFAIILVPITIFLMHKGISDHMMTDDLNVSTEILKDGFAWLEAAGRYRFLAATWFYAALTILAVALLVRTLLRPTATATRLAAIATWSFVILMAGLSTLGNFGEPRETHVFDRLGAAVFEAAMARGSVPGCTRPEDPWLWGQCGENPVVTLFERVMEVVDVLAGLGVGALIVGMILCLATSDSDDIEEQANLLAENLNQMRQQLYLSGLVLTFGMFFATSWMYWPMQLVQDTARAEYGAVLLSAALYTGTFFSLLILSFYLPVALLLDGRVRALARKAGIDTRTADPLDVDSWKATHGLKEGASDYLRAGLALTAPILTAFAGGISPLAI
ncbi:MAG: hypothetical protein AAF999_17110 [Pseudomonadota bacterium]